VRGRIVSARQERPYGPRLDLSNAAFNLMRDLTVTDRGSSPPIFTDDGSLAPR